MKETLQVTCIPGAIRLPGWEDDPEEKNVFMYLKAGSQYDARSCVELRCVAMRSAVLL